MISSELLAWVFINNSYPAPLRLLYGTIAGFAAGGLSTTEGFGSLVSQTCGKARSTATPAETMQALYCSRWHLEDL